MWRVRVLVLTLIGFGCTANDTDWFVAFESSDLASRAEFTRIAIFEAREGVPCPRTSMSEPVFPAILLGAATPTIPPLPSGSYCVVATATDSECRTIARGVLDIELPTSEPLVVVAQEADIACGGTCSPTGRCVGGVCPSDMGYCEAENMCCPGADENACNVLSLTPSFCNPL